jgi:hypothetical protein
LRCHGQVLYVAGWTLLGTLLICRGLSPGRPMIWTGICEWTGFLLVAALLSWALQRFPAVATRLYIPDNAHHGPGQWFCWAQACLSMASATLIVWILLDAAFDELGHGSALFGLSGRLTSCPAALMLLGTVILMAWQTRTRWRAAWQYATFAVAVLLTSSIGWARLDPAADTPWFRRATYVFVSASMMTLLTSFGLARVLPGSGDWLVRARRATPVFGALALALGAIILIRWLVS